MSQAYHQELWQNAQDTIKKIVPQDIKLRKKGPYPDENVAKRLIGRLFMSYVQIVNVLDSCFDQIIHPQKREIIGKLLDLSLGRILELKSEVMRIEVDNYCFFDNTLLELKLTHQDFEIQVPKYFRREREAGKAHRKDLMKLVFQEQEKERFKLKYLENVPDEEKEEAWAKFLANEERERIGREKYEEQQRKLLKTTKEEMHSKLEISRSENARREAIREAITTIQRHERARQGRVQAVLAKRYLSIKKLGNEARVTEAEAMWAAKVIQEHWRRYKKKKRYANFQTRFAEILCFVMPKSRDMTYHEKVNELTKYMRKLQEQNWAEYEEALVKIKDKVVAHYSILFEEDITDEIMSWFRWFFEQTDYLPDFPPQKPVIPTGEVMGIPKKLGPQFYEQLFPKPKSGKGGPVSNSGPSAGQDLPKNNLAIALSGIKAIGGSALVAAGHWLGPREFLMCQKELERLKKKGQGAGGEKKKTKEDKAKEKEAERKRLLAEEALGFQMRESNFLAPIAKADKEYRMIWLNMDESKNTAQRYVPDLIKEEKCYELSMEVRQAVDKMMELELDILKDALERDKNPKKKKKKKKKNNNKKGKKKKQKIDPLGDRSLDELFYELFKNGIIRDYEEVGMKDFKGERSFAAFDMRQKLIDWPPSLGDVLEMILEVILPLGSSRIHQLTPLVKSVCLIGSENSGKERLARTVCTETGAVMFDLTAENVAGKYPGKDGLKMLQLIIDKLSRAVQPSVIFINNAEKTFYKKVPKEEREIEPKRMSKLIKKIVKGIKPQDQILLIGLSSRPWLAQRRPFLKTYQKILLIPQMDYGSYFIIWQELLSSYPTIPNNFDVSALSRVSWGYSYNSIYKAIANVMTVPRISTSKTRPVKQIEFLEELLKMKPIDEKMAIKCIQFYSKLELPKKRAQKLAALREEVEKANKKKK